MKRVIALGFFDGVHIGHGALLKRTSEIAEELGAYPAVMTFDVPPMKSVELITSPAERADIIRRQYGIEDIILLHFDEKMRRMLWNDFILMLRDRYDAVCLVAGYDFRFGYMGDGDSEKLKSECAPRSQDRSRSRRSDRKPHPAGGKAPPRTRSLRHEDGYRYRRDILRNYERRRQTDGLGQRQSFD